MSKTSWLAVACLLLLAPSTSHALGASLSAGAGYLSETSESKLAFELSPFTEIAILRLEVPLELQVRPERAFAVRPGAKLFVPLLGLYARAGYGLGNLGGDGGVTHSLIAGAGWEFSLLDTLGAFVEGTVEPRLRPSGGPTYMLRVGAMLNL